MWEYFAGDEAPLQSAAKSNGYIQNPDVDIVFEYYNNSWNGPNYVCRAVQNIWRLAYMVSDKQREKARAFSDMHKSNKLFVLPNAWNVGSAYVFEKQGFEAVATSSAGIAHDLGYPDGESISFNDLLCIAGKIASRIDIPLSVDFERGYSEINEEVKENARKLIFAGAVGFNLEDGLPNGELSPLGTQIEKIKALSQLKSELEIDFVINARTCTYLLNEANEKNLKIAVERCSAFVEAGADCVFVPGAKDETTISSLVKNINAPVNILLNAALGSFESLGKIGVRRLSAGCYPARFIYGKIIDMACNLYNGDVSELVSHNFSSQKANNYFVK